MVSYYDRSFELSVSAGIAVTHDYLLLAQFYFNVQNSCSIRGTESVLLLKVLLPRSNLATEC